ncbi:hypothetical protein CDZ96_26215 [Mameliella alba]|nr:hypothetical protein CDZ96_26215 [Mameliella alba]
MKFFRKLCNTGETTQAISIRYVRTLQCLRNVKVTSTTLIRTVKEFYQFGCRFGQDLGAETNLI